MAVFNYVAKNMKGEIIKEKQQASSVEEIKSQLMAKGYFLVEIHQAGKEFHLKKEKKVKLKDFVMFCNQFSILLDSGVTITDSISVLQNQTTSKYLATVLDEIHESLLKGVQLSNCLMEYPEVFPDFFVNMIRVGEATGSMDTVLIKLSDFYENEDRINKKIKSASLYPKLVVAAAFGVITLLMVKVLPMFSDILSEMGGELPPITKSLMAISYFLTNNILLVLGSVFAVILIVVRIIRTDKGRIALDTFRIKGPIIKTLTCKIATAKFARSMGLLLGSGIPLINSMEIMISLIENKVVRQRFEECFEKVKAGKNISQSLSQMEVFPPLLIHMVHTGEKTGQLDEMLNRTAKFFDTEVDHGVNQMITLIEPILIIGLAVVVGTILLAVMLPMMNIMESMQ